MTDTTLSKSSSNLRGLIAFGIGCLIFTYAFVQRVSPSVMVGDLMEAFNVSAAALGGLAAWYFYAYASIQLPVGMLIDKYGPRPLFAITMLLSAGGSLLFGQAESLEIAALGRFVIGGTVAFGYVGSLAIASRMFPTSNLPIAIGVLQFLGMSGAVAGQAPLAYLISSIGWRDSMVVFAIVAVILAILAYIFVPSMTNVAQENGKQSKPLEVLKNPQTWYASMIGFSCSGPMLAFAGLWAVPWLQDIHKLSHTAAATTASLTFAGWGIGSALAGILFKKSRNRKKINILAMLAMLLILSGLFLPQVFGYNIQLPQTVLMGALSLLGFLNGTILIAFIYARENNNSENAGTALGTVNMCVVGSGAVMQPFVGYLLDLGWNGLETETGRRIFDGAGYGTAFGSLIAVMILGLLAACLVRDDNLHHN